MVQQTSMEALWSIKPDIGKRQQRVLDTLRQMGTANNREIAARAGMPINTVTPRVKELRDLGFVVLDRWDTDKVTGRRTFYWRACDERQQNATAENYRHPDY